jgi:hypothetical protein
MIALEIWKSICYAFKMRRPGNLRGIAPLTPKHIRSRLGEIGLGMLPPRMGPSIPGPPNPLPNSPVPHPWQSIRIAAVTRRICPSC